MRETTVNMAKDRKDDELPAVTAPLQRLSADHTIHYSTRGGATEDYVSFTIRDEYSGCGLAQPRQTRSKESNYIDLKRFMGPRGRFQRWLICARQ